MAIERFYSQVDAVSFTADGQDIGLVTVTDTSCFKVKMFVIVKADTMEQQRFQVKRVISKTEMLLGPENTPIRKRSDMSMYTLSLNPTVEAPEQERPEIPPADYERASYEEEPTVAKRSYLVNKQGNGYTTENPFPVQLSDGDVNIGTVNAEIEVQLSRRDNNPDAGDVHDSVRLGNQDYELTYTTNDSETKAAADVVALNRLIDVPHDDVEITTFNADGDPTVIEFRDNGELKLTLNLTYNTEGDLQRVQRVKP